MSDNRQRVSISEINHPELSAMYALHIKQGGTLTGFIERLFYNSRFHLNCNLSTERGIARDKVSRLCPSTGTPCPEGGENDPPIEIDKEENNNGDFDPRNVKFEPK